MVGWFRINSAPRDGKYVDLWCVKDGEDGGRVPDARWQNGFWMDDRGDPVEDGGWKVTHWMPRPEGPQQLGVAHFTGNGETTRTFTGDDVRHVGP